MKSLYYLLLSLICLIYACNTDKQNNSNQAQTKADTHTQEATAPKKVEDPNVVPKIAKSWYNGLDATWKAIVSKRFFSGEPTQTELNKMYDELLMLDAGSKQIKSLKPIGELKGLLGIDCSKTPLTSLTGIENFKELKIFNCMKSKVSYLKPLAACPKIEQLMVSFTYITSLEGLEELGNLKMLDFRSSKVKSLVPLTNAQKLEKLICSNNPIENLDPLAKLKSLKEINITNTSIKSLQALANVKSLERIDIGGTPITSLKPLHGLKKLKQLRCRHTKITKKEIDQFKKANPICRVISEFDKTNDLGN